LLFVSGALLTVPASASSSAAAVSCTRDYVNADEGSGTLTVGAHLKVGPYAECADIVWMPAGTLVRYWCYYENVYGNEWSFVRIAGTQTHGWVYDGHLNNGGSTQACTP
jgi:hypothetical protein